MKEKDKIQFWDTSTLEETADIRNRCNASYIEEQLKSRFPMETIHVASVSINETGSYKSKSSLLVKLIVGFSVKGLPPFCEVQIDHQTGKDTEHIIVWSPLAWNDRFAGTAGGGNGTGGLQYIIPPNNTLRGWMLPYALINGFTTATGDSGNATDSHDWAVDPETRELNHDLIENWRARGTHFMTVFGKAVAEILHQRPVRFAYMSGGSGGGRQCLVEAQEFPDDYDGIWASSPAINWTKFVLVGFWPIAVMNSYGHILKPNKMKYFMTAVHDSVGGKDSYYKLEERVDFDPETLVGCRTRDGPINKMDATVMKEIWNGPRRKNGQRLWYSFRPGVKFWNVGLPVGAFYYSLIRKKPKPFIICTSYARWITKNPKQDFNDITMEEFEELFDKSTSLFVNAGGDNPDLRSFAQAGGKLILDHGLDDPLIPVDGTIDYYDRMCDIHGGKEFVDEFCKMYLPPGDGHGNCFGNGPGIAVSDGMRALVNWVENGQAPDALRVVQVKRRGGKTISEGEQLPY